MEIITGPVPAQSPFIPLDAKIVVGAVAPASPDPIPIVLLPGFEYRMSEWRHPETHEIHWRLERRKAAQHGEEEKRSPRLVVASRSALADSRTRGPPISTAVGSSGGVDPGSGPGGAGSGAVTGTRPGSRPS